MDGKLCLADREDWAQNQFGTADLGDVRRTRRLVKLAAQMAGNSSGSIPQQTGAAADMKAAYRLFAEDDVTHEAVCGPHFARTRKRAGGLPVVFLLQDTSTLDFSSHEQCEGLGPISAKPHQRGLHQQNMLAIDPQVRRPLGLMYQSHHCRRARPAGHSNNRTATRHVPIDERESYWWIQAIRAIGSPPADVRWVHVGDRGEDIFGVYDEARRHGADWLIRIAKDRRVQTPQGAETLFSYARRLPSVTSRCLTVQRPGARSCEQVQLNVAAGPVDLLPPRAEAAYRDCPPVACCVVRVWEENPPAGAAPLEWLLCTSLSCATSEQAQFAAEGYSFRWMIEEFHKCEKTGCQVEMRRLTHVDRLEPLLGLLSVLAVALLQLKFVARDQPDEPAQTLVDAFTVKVMARYLGRKSERLTVAEFWGGVGRLGGHPGRKRDGPLGWLRAWKGWQSFQLMMMGATLARESEKCG